MGMYDDKVVLCGANSYNEKYYLNPDFEGLPDHVKEELKIMCVLYVHDVGGVLTLVFEENGELILLDYKTDHVSKQDGADILKKRYKRQLDDYQQALEQMLQKKVRQKLIYSFALKCWIEI